MFTIVVDRPGDTPLELTPVANTVSWDSAVPGGHGSCGFTVPGLLNRRQMPYLAVIRLYYGTYQLWEGRVEDITLSVPANATTVKAFGWRRALDFTSVRRVWSTRSQQFSEVQGAIGQIINNTSSDVPKDPGLSVLTGNFDATDLTKRGCRVQGAGQTAVAGSYGNGGQTLAAAGVTWVRALATIVVSAGANMGSGKFQGVAVGFDTNATATQTFIDTSSTLDMALITGCHDFRWLVENAGSAATPTSDDYADLYNLRLLGTTLIEDAAGGFYGGTLLADLIGLVTGLELGTVENGSDFLIEQLERSARDTAASVVDEIAGYYAREWAVWENGRFDWITTQLDEPQFIMSLADLTSLDMTGSLDTIVGTSYVLYTDAATGIDSEQSSDATSQRNPFVRTGETKDDLTSPGIVMTANTAAQYAARIAAERGNYPPVTGTITLPATTLVSDHTGQKIPAFCIRAGRNVYLPDLPRDEIFTAGRDGQTLFHVVQASASMDDETVTLQLEGQGRQLDVIQTRLAAVTKTLTG